MTRSRSLAAPFLFLLAGFSAPCLSMAVADAEEAEEIVRVGAPLWSGTLDDVDPDRSPFAAAALSPDGKTIAYVQGAPWPRVLARRLEADASGADLMLGAVLPVGEGPPRFSPDGQWVYFSATDRTAPRGASDATASDATAYARTHVVRARVADGTLEFVYPPRGTAAPVSAVLLDVAPQDDRLLIGVTEGGRPQPGDAPRALEVAELATAGESAPRKLGWTIAAGARARYAPDGKAVEYASGDGSKRPEARRVLYRFSGEKSERLAGLFADEEHVAGRLAIARRLVPHLGSFGDDPYFLERVRTIGAGLAARARLTFDANGGEAQTPPPLAICFGETLVLLRAQGEDSRRYAVAPYRREEVERPAGAFPPTRAAALVLPERFGAGTILAAGDDTARSVLEEVFRSLRVAEAATPPAALAATLVERSLAGADGEEDPRRRRLEVQETLSGRLRLERIRDVEAESAPAAGGDAPPSFTRSQTVAFDGERCWSRSESDAVRDLAPEELARWLRGVSLYRLLLDPAGLGDPRVRFGTPETTAGDGIGGDGDGDDDGGGSARVALPFSYEDGFRGRLVLARRGALLLPETIETPGSGAPRGTRLRFLDWREWEGFRIPTAVAFEDGRDDRLVGVLALHALAEIDDEVFAVPAR